MLIAPRDDPNDPPYLDGPVDLDDFERADPFGHAVIIAAVRHRYRLRVLVGRWRRVETWLRDEATPDERAAYEAAVGGGLAHLRRYREPTDLVRHFWEDPKCVASAPGQPPRLVEPPWIAEACRLHGGEHKLSTIAIEALAYGRRLGETVREYLYEMML